MKIDKLGQYVKTSKLVVVSDNLKIRMSEEIFKNYENGEWIPSSKTIRAFDDSDNLTLIEYWSYDETLKKWEGSSKIEYTLNTKGDILGYLDYGWENDNWMASKKSEITEIKFLPIAG